VTARGRAEGRAKPRNRETAKPERSLSASKLSALERRACECDDEDPAAAATPLRNTCTLKLKKEKKKKNIDCRL
jgi:hypothetical protein